MYFFIHFALYNVLILATVTINMAFEDNGLTYTVNLGKTYVLQNDIEYTGIYDNIANLIKNNEIEF